MLVYINKHNISFHLHEIHKFESQRINDIAIMNFLLTSIKNTLFLKNINTYRIYLEVTTITDITNPAGIVI